MKFLSSISTLKSFIVIAITAAIGVISLQYPANAASCSKKAAKYYRDKGDLDDLLRLQGKIVSRIQLQKGCYLVIGLNKKGEKFSALYNADNLKLVSESDPILETQE